MRERQRLRRERSRERERERESSRQRGRKRQACLWRRSLYNDLLLLRLSAAGATRLLAGPSARRLTEGHKRRRRRAERIFHTLLWLCVVRWVWRLSRVSYRSSDIYQRLSRLGRGDVKFSLSRFVYFRLETPVDISLLAFLSLSPCASLSPLSRSLVGPGPSDRVIHSLRTLSET